MSKGVAKIRLDGGPAFPKTGYFSQQTGLNDYDTRNEDGMTLHDYFAGQALVGLLSHGVDGTWQDTAQMACEIADEMVHISELNKGRRE